MQTPAQRNGAKVTRASPKRINGKAISGLAIYHQDLLKRTASFDNNL
jgi:hypothetical protein